MPMELKGSAIAVAGPSQANLDPAGPGVYLLGVEATTYPSRVAVGFNLSTNPELDEVVQFLNPWWDCPRAGLFRTEVKTVIGLADAMALEFYEPIDRSSWVKPVVIQTYGGFVTPFLEVPAGWSCNFYLMGRQ